MENSREDANAATGILRDGGEIYGTPPSVLSFFSAQGEFSVDSPPA